MSVKIGGTNDVVQVENEKCVDFPTWLCQWGASIEFRLDFELLIIVHQSKMRISDFHWSVKFGVRFGPGERIQFEWREVYSRCFQTYWTGVSRQSSFAATASSFVIRVMSFNSTFLNSLACSDSIVSLSLSMSSGVSDSVVSGGAIVFSFKSDK